MGFNGTVDLFEEADSSLLRRTVDLRKRQQCSYSIVGARVASGRDWKKWRAAANSFWTPGYRVLPAAVITEKEVDPGRILSLPKHFRFLLIPCFTELPLELPLLELFGFVRGSGGLTCLIPPWPGWNSLTCGLSAVDLHTVMVNGRADLSTALYHLNRRVRAGFIGINQLKEPGRSGVSFNRIFPVQERVSEYDIFNCFRQSRYSVSNSCENFIECRSEPERRNGADIVGDRISFAFSCRRGKVSVLLYKNGRGISREKIESRPVSRDFQTTGKDYYYLVTSEPDFCSISAPFFARSPHQLWGDHHVHNIFKNSLQDSRMDYVVHGLYGSAGRYEDFAGIVPGGEIHGTAARGRPDNLHFLVVQNSRKDHSYSWEPGEGNEKTLQRARKFRDFIILAHPDSRTAGYLPSSISPDGIEVLHGFSLFAALINQNPGLKRRAMAFFRNELAPHTKKNDSVKIAAALWDELLGRGRKCLALADGDLFGPSFHGMFANNLGAGYPATVINAENAALSKVHGYLRTGNAWCVTTGFVNLHLKVNGKEMGKTAGLQRRNHVELIAESCFPIAEIRFISQHKIIRKLRRESHEIAESLILPARELGKYLRAELIDKEGNTALANPVYITGN